VTRTHGATVDELAASGSAPVIVQRVPRRIEHVWTPDGLFTFEQRGAFVPIIAFGAECYQARTTRDGTICVEVGRFSGVEIVNYFPYKGPKPTRDRVTDYRAALALERKHGERIDQELGRSAQAHERDGARATERRRSSERRAAGRAVSPVRDRRARA
jgi:hypothetical protein